MTLHVLLLAGCGPPAGWVSISTEDVPVAISFDMVWTGQEALVWHHRGGYLYDVAGDAWTVMSMEGAPAPRRENRVLWTGRELLVFDGATPDREDDTWMVGALYDPIEDTWRAMSDVGVPPAVAGYSAAWTGDELLIWGGYTRTDELTRSGARYHPDSDTWTPMSEANAPSARLFQHSGWTERDLVIWGGKGADDEPAFLDDIDDQDEGVLLADGARYDPVSDSWSPITDRGAPAPGEVGWVVSTGTELLFLYTAEGGERTLAGYDPVADAWSALDVPRDATPGHLLWTGSALMAWGEDLEQSDDARGPWTAVPAPDPTHVATWTGDQLIGWGLLRAPFLREPRFAREGWIYTP